MFSVRYSLAFISIFLSSTMLANIQVSPSTINAEGTETIISVTITGGSLTPTIKEREIEFNNILEMVRNATTNRVQVFIDCEGFNKRKDKPFKTFAGALSNKLEEIKRTLGKIIYMNFSASTPDYIKSHALGNGLVYSDVASASVVPQSSFTLFSQEMVSQSQLSTTLSMDEWLDEGEWKQAGDKSGGNTVGTIYRNIRYVNASVFKNGENSHTWTFNINIGDIYKANMKCATKQEAMKAAYNYILEKEPLALIK